MILLVEQNLLYREIIFSVAVRHRWAVAGFNRASLMPLSNFSTLKMAHRSPRKLQLVTADNVGSAHTIRCFELS